MIYSCQGPTDDKSTKWKNCSNFPNQQTFLNRTLIYVHKVRIVYKDFYNSSRVKQETTRCSITSEKKQEENEIHFREWYVASFTNTTYYDLRPVIKLDSKSNRLLVFVTHIPWPDRFSNFRPWRMDAHISSRRKQGPTPVRLQYLFPSLAGSLGEGEVQYRRRKKGRKEERKASERTAHL